jgi:hypothetical protein
MHFAALIVASGVSCTPGFVCSASGDSCDIWNGLERIPGHTGPANTDFQWIDGTPVDFVNWNVGQPDDFCGNTEDCVAYDQLAGNNLQWSDVQCFNMAPAFVCKQAQIIG